VGGRGGSRPLANASTRRTTGSRSEVGRKSVAQCVSKNRSVVRCVSSDASTDIVVRALRIGLGGGGGGGGAPRKVEPLDEGHASAGGDVEDEARVFASRADDDA
jgi:hypothetical protein